MAWLDERACVELSASATSVAGMIDEPAINGGWTSSSIATAIHHVRALEKGPVNGYISLGRNPSRVDIAVKLHIVGGTVRRLH